MIMAVVASLSVCLGTKIDRFVSECCRHTWWTVLVYVWLIHNGASYYVVARTTFDDVDDTRDLQLDDVEHNSPLDIIEGYNVTSRLRHTEQLLTVKEDLYELCRPGERYRHPFSRHWYLECKSSGSGFITKLCPKYSTFDREILACSPGGSSCMTSLLRHRRSVRESDVENNSDMGSGDVSDANAADGGLSPGGNGTAEVVNPKPDLSDDTVKVEVTEGHIVPVVHDVTVPILKESLNSTVAVTDTTTQTTTTTKIIPPETTTTEALTTKPLATSSPEVIVTDKSSQDPNPPYVIVTDTPHKDVTTHKNNVTKAAPPDDVSKTSSNAGVVVGVILGLVIVVIIIVIVVILIKKKKIKVPKKIKKVSVKRKKIVTKMENPQYQDIGGKDYRFSCDTPLHIGGPTANLTKFNNPNLAETPVPRVLQNESPTTNKRSSLPRSIAARRDKRKAPPPPNPFGEYDAEKADLYETASQASGEVEMQTFAVRNENATEPPEADQEPSYPLLKRSNSTKDKVKDKNDNDNAEAENDNVPASSDSLLPKDKGKSQDNMAATKTPDDYDLTKNPFFEED